MLQKHINSIILLALIAGLAITGNYHFDLGDYKVQTEHLLQQGSFIKDGSILNRYPPVTTLVYYGFIKLTSFAPLSKTILLLHLVLALGIQLLFNRILMHFGYNKEGAWWKNALRSLVLLNPFILSFIIRGANSELLYINFALAALLCLLEYREKKQVAQLLLTGLFIGLATLTRTQGYTLFIASLVVFWLMNVRLQLAAVIIPVILVIAPWQILNSSYSDSFISSGVLPSFRDGLSFNNKPHRSPISLPASVDTFSRQFFEIYYIKMEDQGILPAVPEKKWVADYLIDHPKTAIDLAVLKFFRCFYGTDSQTEVYERINKILIGSIMLLFIIALIYTRKIKAWDNHYLLWIFIVCALNVAMSMMALSILRYQAPLLPFLFILILIAIDKRFKPISS